MSNNDDWEQLAYQEISEDRRHYDTMLWEIPTAIFAVDSIVLGVVSSVASYILVQEVLLGFALFFTLVLTWSLYKHVSRAYQRAELLKRIENEKPVKYIRYPHKEKSIYQVRLGYLMVLLLVAFAIFLIILMISPNIIPVVKSLQNNSTIP